MTEEKLTEAQLIRKYREALAEVTQLCLRLNGRSNELDKALKLLGPEWLAKTQHLKDRLDDQCPGATETILRENLEKRAIPVPGRKGRKAPK